MGTRCFVFQDAIILNIRSGDVSRPIAHEPKYLDYK